MNCIKVYFNFSANFNQHSFCSNYTLFMSYSKVTLFIVYPSIHTAYIHRERGRKSEREVILGNWDHERDLHCDAGWHENKRERDLYDCWNGHLAVKTLKCIQVSNSRQNRIWNICKNEAQQRFHSSLVTFWNESGKLNNTKFSEKAINFPPRSLSLVFLKFSGKFCLFNFLSLSFWNWECYGVSC